MPFDDSNPITNSTEGITKGILSWSTDKIKVIAQKFRDRKLVFINNQETINLVKEQLNSGDWSLCQQYLKDKELKILVQMGLALRKLESNSQQLQNLRDKIVQKYHSKGLHIAQVVQNGILTEFIGSIASKVNSGSEIIENVESLLSNVDKFVIFIKALDNSKKKYEEIHIKLKANEPPSMILFSSKSAINICLEIKKLLEKEDIGYLIETKEEKQRLLLFLFKKPSDQLFI